MRRDIAFIAYLIFLAFVVFAVAYSEHTTKKDTENRLQQIEQRLEIDNE